MRPRLIVRQPPCQAPPDRIAGDFLPQTPLPSWRYLSRLLKWGRAAAGGRRRNADGMGRHGRGDLPNGTAQDTRTIMQRSRTRLLTAVLGAAMLFVGGPTFAQNAE